MDLELVKFINSDLTWSAVKKGHRSMVRRPRRPVASSPKFGFDSGNKMQDSVAFDYEKSGVAILGQHFAEEVLDVPIKKRIRMLQSPSVSDERARSTQPQPPSSHHEESEMPEGSKQVCHSMKPKNGSTNSEQSKLIEKEVPDLNDFSGIELLAAAACHSSVYDSPAPMLSSAVEVHTTQRVESYTDGVKEDIAPIDSDDSSVQDSMFPVTQNICDNGNGDGDKRPVPSKDVRLHWDLNTVMDEWEEPCCDILVDPHSEKGYLKDGLQDAKTNLEGYETTNSQITGGDHEQVKSDAIDKSDGRQAVSEVVQGGCQDDKVTLDDRLSDCCGSNTIDKVKAGYESPVEDGELRDTWQKDEVEEMECVDYESDNLYEDNFDTIESVNNEVIGALGAVVPNNIEQDDKKNVPSISNQLPEHSQSAISEEKNRIPSFGVRKNDACISRSRSENIEDSYSRGKRDFGPENFMGRDRPSYKGRARHDSGRWDDSSIGGWDSRNNQRYPRTKHVIGGSSVRDTQPINYNSRDTYKTFNTRPSPLHKNESFGIHRGTQRGISRDRFKGGLGFHVQESRREEYNGPDPCHSERKVSSFSPNLNRGAHISRSRRRSRSRSRSESPIAWNFQKKRNVDTKRQSPENKTDTRFQVDRYNINDQYRDRRASPVRTGGYNLGRVKSSDHFYPTSRSGRYPPQADGQYDDKFGMMNGGGRFRYHVDDSFRTRNKDNGFRYSRNENRYFKDPVGARDFHKDDLQRE